MDPGGKYGLILPKKKTIFQKKTTTTIKPRLSVFNNDDSSDEEGQKEVNSQIHREAMKKIVKKQTKLEIQKALEQDSTVYEYDNIYDDMKKQANQKNIPAKASEADKQKKPKYISQLIKAAESRNRERQRVEERKIEKERKNEGDEFKDKPQFVTSTYRKRMQERQEEEENERRMAAIEEIMDVRKQKDLSGFYKHLLRQQVGEEPHPGERVEESNSDIKQVNENPDEEDQDTDLSFSSSEEDEHLAERSPERNRSSEEEEQLARQVDDPNRRSSDKRNQHKDGKRSSHQQDSTRPRSPESKHSERKHSEPKHSERKHSDRKRRSRSPERHTSKRELDGKSSECSRRSPERKQSKVEKKDAGDDTILPIDKKQSTFAKRSNADAVLSARDRYLARKKGSKAARAPVEPDSD